MVRLALLVAVGVSVSACCCKLPEPTSDSSPPSAGVIVEYRTPAGVVETVTITAGDADQTVDTDADREIAVIYMGSDNEGLRRVRLHYDMRRSGTNSTAQPLLVEKKVESSCPEKVLTGAENFHAGGQDWDYEFGAWATNWVGTETRSATLTVRAR